MRIAFITILSVITGLLTVSCAKDKEPNTYVSNPVTTIFLADPTIFYDNGMYYLYGTSQGALESLGKGFVVYQSANLANWEGPIGNTNGFALQAADAFGTDGFWAPQVFKKDNTYYMAYTANEKIGIATASSPLGPFTNNGNAIDNNVTQIDPFVFFDDNGTPYLYHVRFNNGNKIYVAEMNTDLASIKPETLTEIISGDAPWENTENTSWPVTEGPTVLKHNGLYYLTYSANDFRSPDYAVGYATSTSPLGPWTKAANNPIIHGDMIGESGAGHGDIVFNTQGNMQYVLHTHFSHAVVHPRKTGIISLQFTNNQLTATPETFHFLELLTE